jgi:hypothetical protein
LPDSPTLSPSGTRPTAARLMPRALTLGDSVGLSGKVGATYGITHVSAVADAGLPSGRDKGLGLGYGVALDVNVIRGIHGAVGWEQHDFHFAGQGTSKVKNVTLALGYTF